MAALRRPGQLLGAALVGLVLAAAACGPGSDGGGGPSDAADIRLRFDIPEDDRDVPVSTFDVRKETSAPDGDGGRADLGGDVPAVCQPGRRECPFLAPCTTNGDCISGWCVATFAGKVCSTDCIEDCGVEGWSCEQNPATLPDVTYICVQLNAEVCRPCKQHSDCQSPFSGQGNRCLAFGPDGAFCGVACSDAAPCPRGYTCVQLRVDEEETRQCVADDGVCKCTAAFWGAATYCYVDNQYGTCYGDIRCERDGFTPCSAPVPAYEQCNNRDDDCDGLTDEVADLGTESCGLGVCTHTIESCVAGFPQICDPMQGASFERCNGLDDDCDGLTDEDWPDKFGPCDGEDADRCQRGRLVCSSNGQTLICEGDQPETLEECNGLDDDCDGLTDEAEDLGSTTCGLGICAHEVSLCVDGEWVDCDPFEGAQPTDDPDPLRVDTNCDGIDGDEARAVFVDAFNGGDGNEGTKTQPLRSLQAGIDRARARGKPHVYVSVGTYQPITLADGVSVYGGYNAAEAWRRDPSNTVTITGGTKAVIGFDISQPTVLDTLTIVGTGNGQPGGSSYGVFLVRSGGVRLVACQISAGDGGNGVAGTNGSNGSNGDSGNMGGSGCEDGGCVIFAICSSCSRPPGGSGGQRVCTSADGSVDVGGGNGGAGGESESAGLAGASGRGPSPGAGGAGGARAKTNGQPGGPGNPGANGTAGAAGAVFGALSEAGYGAANGGNGQPGGHGGGGGGGGSGGGDGCEFFSGSWCQTYGSGGGGGGAGGCGATAGFGGGGGGGSFGVFLWGSSATIQGGTVATARGGQGGAGGAGGIGGQGGRSGQGGPHGDDDNQGDGAPGGTGGAGGDGGHGGGGGGGPSIGVICGGGARPTFTQVEWRIGTPGSGGVSPGASGARGETANYFGCF
jgi:hypothetical protein